jgi:predicted lipid-binding transport protein (Tim44 family)
MPAKPLQALLFRRPGHDADPLEILVETTRHQLSLSSPRLALCRCRAYVGLSLSLPRTKPVISPRAHPTKDAMEGFQFIDIILLAMVAGFIVLRLRNVLGRRTGHEPGRDGPAPVPRPGSPAPDNVVNLPTGLSRRPSGPQTVDIEPAYQGTPHEAGMVQVKLADPSFSAEGFLQGSGKAFEMIVAAYAKNDLDTLRTLLSPDVYAQFASAIQDREQRGETLSSELVVLKPPRLESIEMRGSAAHVSVIFQSEQTNVTKNKAGEIVEGSPDHIESVTDIWTFSRDTQSRDPNWMLVATRSVD